MLRKMYVWIAMTGYCVSLVGCGQSTSSKVASSQDVASARPARDAEMNRYEGSMPGHESLKIMPGSHPSLASPASKEELGDVDATTVRMTPTRAPSEGIGPGMSGDKHSLIVEHSFVPVQQSPLSTFSIDVDTASYSKTRMHVMQRNSLPPADAVRIEELVNYFDYDYSPPAGEHPFSIHVEVADAPWKPGHRLARIGLKGKELDHQRPSSNLVFLLDVSGSMDYRNKLPLVKQGMRLLTSQLGENDRVAIVVYAGAAGLVLPSTLGSDRHRILDAVDQLHAGGSTNGGEGIQLAYQVARQNYIRGGINRVMLCTDGDFNVGTTGGALVRLAEVQAKAGVYLSVLGFGMGNHNDAMLEELSNKANGNYAFIDNEAEARKVLLDQADSTLVTIAKDVKIQIEFNPAYVAAYRLIGYENRHLEAHEFNDDRKDAGEIGAGHTVTALYEIIPAGEGAHESIATVDPLKYQKKDIVANGPDELMTVKLRYKEPDAGKSKLVVAPVQNAPVRFGEATRDFKFASAVASFGMLLRHSENRGEATYASVLEIANASRGEDRHGYRGEFIEMVAMAGRLAGEQVPDLSAVAPPANEPNNRSQAVVTYYERIPQSPAASRFTSQMMFWTLGFAGLIVGVCVVLAAVLFGIRRLVLPTDIASEPHVWPCTHTQRTCLQQKPPVRV